VGKLKCKEIAAKGILFDSKTSRKRLGGKNPKDECRESDIADAHAVVDPSSGLHPSKNALRTN
jgi:hypothetical protein